MWNMKHELKNGTLHCRPAHPHEQFTWIMPRTSPQIHSWESFKDSPLAAPIPKCWSATTGQILWVPLGYSNLQWNITGFGVLWMKINARGITSPVGTDCSEASSRGSGRWSSCAYRKQNRAMVTEDEQPTVLCEIDVSESQWPTVNIYLRLSRWLSPTINIPAEARISFG